MTTEFYQSSSILQAANFLKMEEEKILKTLAAVSTKEEIPALVKEAMSQVEATGKEECSEILLQQAWSKLILRALSLCFASLSMSVCVHDWSSAATVGLQIT